MTSRVRRPSRARGLERRGRRGPSASGGPHRPAQEGCCLPGGHPVSCGRRPGPARVPRGCLPCWSGDTGVKRLRVKDSVGLFRLTKSSRASGRWGVLHAVLSNRVLVNGALDTSSVRKLLQARGPTTRLPMLDTRHTDCPQEDGGHFRPASWGLGPCVMTRQDESSSWMTTGNTGKPSAGC